MSLAIFHPHFVIRILSSAFFYPHFIIRIFLSAFYHPHFSIRILSSAFFYPHFIIRIFLSAFYHPHFIIRHPPSAAIRSALYRDPALSVFSWKPAQPQYVKTKNNEIGQRTITIREKHLKIFKYIYYKPNKRESKASFQSSKCARNHTTNESRVTQRVAV